MNLKDQYKVEVSGSRDGEFPYIKNPAKRLNGLYRTSRTGKKLKKKQLDLLVKRYENIYENRKKSRRIKLSLINMQKIKLSL